jgi:hypothetical protein
MVGKSANINTNLHIWGIINYLASVNQHSYADILDGQYGEVRIPRYFKDAEIRNDSLYFTDNNRFEIYEATNINLDVNLDYIWLINEEGWLIIGEEKLIEGHSDKKIGHVALNKGRPGRIAGELRYSNLTWFINSKSGRYSGNYSSENAKKYLQNAIEKRFTAYIKEHDFQISN